MKNINKHVLIKKEDLGHAKMTANQDLPTEKIALCADKLHQALLDPNQRPGIEVFIELE